MFFFSTNKYSFFFLRALLSISLLIFIFFNFDFKNFTVISNKSLFQSLIFSILLLSLALFIISLRWHLVCSFFGLPLKLKTSFKLVIIGQFFNHLLPTSIGGDFFRSYALWKNYNSIKLSVLSVVLDRLIGLGTLLILILFGLPLLSINLSSKIPVIIAISIFIVSIGVMLFFVNIESFKSLKKISIFSKIVDIIIKGKVLVCSRIFVISVLISFVVHSSSLLIIYLISNSLGAEMTLIETILVVPAVLLITALPLSIGGWGVREAGLVGGFSLIGLDASVALATSILYGSINIFLGLFGGLLFLFHRQ